MGFKNYCIVVLGNLKGVDNVIRSMAEFDPNVLHPEGGILISTFSSLAEVASLTDYFKMYIDNFMLYELSPKNSGQSFKEEKIQDGLFSFLEKMDEAALKEKTEEFMKVVTGTTKPSTLKTVELAVVVEPLSTDEYIATLSYDERNNLMNDIIKKGADKLTNADKNLLGKLAK